MSEPEPGPGPGGTLQAPRKQLAGSLTGQDSGQEGEPGAECGQDCDVEGFGTHGKYYRPRRGQGGAY